MQPIFQSIYQTYQHQNKMDGAMGLISLHVSNSLQFHLDGCNTLLDMWTKIDGLFDIVNEFRALQIEVELTFLVLDSFPSIEDLLMKSNQQKSLL